VVEEGKLESSERGLLGLYAQVASSHTPEPRRDLAAKFAAVFVSGDGTTAERRMRNAGAYVMMEELVMRDAERERDAERQAINKIALLSDIERERDAEVHLRMEECTMSDIQRESDAEGQAFREQRVIARVAEERVCVCLFFGSNAPICLCAYMCVSGVNAVFMCVHRSVALRSSMLAHSLPPFLPPSLPPSLPCACIIPEGACSVACILSYTAEKETCRKGKRDGVRDLTPTCWSSTLR
jgi:hypothetical protein